jgi:hypothetical protein
MLVRAEEKVAAAHGAPRKAVGTPFAVLCRRNEATRATVTTVATARSRPPWPISGLLLLEVWRQHFLSAQINSYFA